MERELGFIGGGMMAGAIINSLISQGYPKGKIMVFDPDPKRRQELSGLGLQVLASNAEVVQKAAGVICAVKPQVLPEVFRDLPYPPQTPFLSIVAGYTIARLAALLPEGTRILRAMPNTPGLIQAGITALSPSESASEEDLVWGQEILGALGKVVIVPERLMDAVTALSGSGPGYVYKFIEALIDAGVLLGLPRGLARELTLQTVIGSARMVAESGEHPGVLRDMVTSPGGTTMTGLAEMEYGGFTGLIYKALLAAAKKAEEIGQSG
ncbi:MAG TPA: pyrroline-5-carboxylate reductase [Bacillota bacterium]